MVQCWEESGTVAHWTHPLATFYITNFKPFPFDLPFGNRQREVCLPEPSICEEEEEEEPVSCRIVTRKSALLCRRAELSGSTYNNYFVAKWKPRVLPTVVKDLINPTWKVLLMVCRCQGFVEGSIQLLPRCGVLNIQRGNSALTSWHVSAECLQCACLEIWYFNLLSSLQLRSRMNRGSWGGRRNSG